jgi:aromatic ring-cleaving dioxygenase
MEKSLLQKEILPFAALFAALLAATAITDILLHTFDMIWIGRWLGIPGTLLILVSFLYSLRKRNKIAFGRPISLLKLHEALALIGSLMIMVHAGIHIYAILPWLALLAMAVNILSGLTGKYLLDRSRRHLDDKQAHYRQQGLTGEALQQRLFWDATAFDAMKKWRLVHLPITLAFAVLGSAHLISIFLFWEWR